MPERLVLRYGDPRLHQVSAPVGAFEPGALDALLADLWDTMEARGGIGIAAPQIGEFVRVVVFGLEHSERYPEAPEIPRTVLVDPVIEPLDDTLVDGWEGCLSVPGLRGLETDPSVLGVPFYIMEHIEGRIPGDMPPYNMDGWMLRETTEEQRATLWRAAVATMASTSRPSRSTVRISGCQGRRGYGFALGLIGVLPGVVPLSSDDHPLVGAGYDRLQGRVAPLASVLLAPSCRGARPACRRLRWG